MTPANGKAVQEGGAESPTALADGSGAAAMALVPSNVQCVRCGYVLAGLKPDGVCPECGLPVETSVRDVWLTRRSVSYRWVVRSGAAMVLFGTAVMTIGFYVALGVALLWHLVPESVLLAAGLTVLAGALAKLAGWWQLTRLDRAFNLVDQCASRIAVRWAIIAMLVGAMGITAAIALDIRWGNLGFPVFVVASGVLYFSSLLYVHRLGARIPSRKVSSGAVLAMALGPFMPLLMFVAGLVLMDFGHDPAGFFVALSGPLLSAILYCLPIAGLWRRVPRP